MRAVIHINSLKHQQFFGKAIRHGLECHGITVEWGEPNEPRPCDFAVMWGWKQPLLMAAQTPLLGWVEDKVVADATLHRNRAGARWHSGEVRVLVAPEYRNRGLGTTLLRELAQIADKNGLERLLFEAVAEKEEAAIQAAKFMGFFQVGTLGNFAKDLDGHSRDLVLLELPLGKWLEWWSF